MPLELNQKAPDFTLPSTTGSNFTLRYQLGKPLIIYFYPRDFTPGCITEACEFRDTFSFFSELSMEVIGISRDSIETHLAFKKEYNLPFPLLSDKDGKVADLYKASLPLVKFTRRITYFLDKTHKVLGIYENLFNGKKHILKMMEMVSTTTPVTTSANNYYLNYLRKRI